jgi:type IV pilus biogenesis protein CpaD/CtpE
MQHVRLLLILLTLPLAACEMSTPSALGVRDIELRQVPRVETVDLLRPDAGRASVLAASYARSGSGPVTVTAPVADKAGAAAWKKLLLKNGVPKVDIALAAPGSPQGQGAISWLALTASAPEECNVRIPGHQGAEDLNYSDKYVVGCETKAALARQIANPADLMGRSGTLPEDSKRAATLTDDNRNGVPNDPIGGSNASDVGSKAGSGGGGG